MLVAEGDPLIAMDIAETISGSGFEVVGPAGSVTRALALIERTRCDVAILDATLKNETAEPVARRLMTSNIPFVIVSGYSRAQLPATLRDAPLIGKPLTPELLVAEIKRCVDIRQ